MADKHRSSVTYYSREVDFHSRDSQLGLSLQTRGDASRKRARRIIIIRATLLVEI